MSTLEYAALTTRREEAVAGTSKSTSPPGIKSYVDVVAALVPAEVLTLHAMCLSVTTSTEARSGGGPVTTITEPVTLRWAFLGLVLISIVLYVVPRYRRWDRLDFLRVFIPPSAFVAWTMLQRTTAFDAVCPELGAAPRTVIALFAATLLGVLAAILSNSADKKPPP
jgi:uncharacterized membrane protein (DUF4010 family)